MARAPPQDLGIPWQPCDRFSMPPQPAWFRGRRDIEEYLRSQVFNQTGWRLVPTLANMDARLSVFTNGVIRGRLSSSLRRFSSSSLWRAL